MEKHWAFWQCCLWRLKVRCIVHYFLFLFSWPQVLEAQRRHQKEKSGIIPTSPTPYTYNKVSYETVHRMLSLKHSVPPSPLMYPP